MVSTANFPGTAPFRLTIQDSAASTPEIVMVTGISGNTYTITRGFEGTTASAHSGGAQVGQFVTAGVISNIVSTINSMPASSMPAFTGDTTTSAGSTATTTGKVNSVAYPPSPAANTIPVVTGTNQVTYETAPVAAGGTGNSFGNGVLDSYLAPRAVCIGDSITAGATGNTDSQSAAGVNQTYGQSFCNLAAFLTNGRVRLVHNAGIGGNTTTQMLARWQTSVANFNPNVVIILGGTNDTGTNNLTLTEDNLKQMVANTIALGATPIMGTIPPNATTITGAAQYAFCTQLNSWIRAFATKNKILLVDNWKLLIDPITGDYKTQYNLAISATGGTYTMTIAPWQSGGTYDQTPLGLTAPATTGTIAYNATAAQVQTAINAANSGKIKMVVTGPAGGPYNIYNPEGYPLVLTTNAAGLTGGSGTATITNGLQYGQDGTHPTVEGQIVMARAYKKRLLELYPDTSITGYFSDNNNDSNSVYGYAVTDNSNFVKNSCFTYFTAPGDTTGTLAGGYQNINSVSWNYVQDSTQCGNVLNVSTTAGNAYIILGPNISPSTGLGYSDGDVIAFSGHIQSAGFEQTNVTNLGSATAAPQFGCSLSVQATSGNYSFSPVSWGYDASGTFYGETTLPTGTTNMFVQCFGGGTNTQQVRVSGLSLIDLTTFGAGN